MRDSQAARSLLVRRLKCLANYENANRTLEKARQKNKDIHAVSIIILLMRVRYFIKLNLFSHAPNQRYFNHPVTIFSKKTN